MAQHQIVANGIDMGIYEGADADEALDAYARDAGYPDYATLCDDIGADPSEARAIAID